VDIQSEMDRMFEDFFRGGLARGGRRGADQVVQWAPAIDAVHRDGDLVVRAELPGVKPEDVDITLHNGVLTISGCPWSRNNVAPWSSKNVGPRDTVGGLFKAVFPGLRG
jgi:HSP20 family molecular chaperone IbpA